MGLALVPAAWSGAAEAGGPSTEVLWDGATADGRTACIEAGGRIVEMPVIRVLSFGGEGERATPMPSAAQGTLCVLREAPAADRAPETAGIVRSTLNATLRAAATGADRAPMGPYSIYLERSLGAPTLDRGSDRGATPLPSAVGIAAPVLP